MRDVRKSKNGFAPALPPDSLIAKNMEITKDSHDWPYDPVSGILVSPSIS